MNYLNNLASPFQFFLLHQFTLVESRDKEDCNTFLTEVFLPNSSQLFWGVGQHKLSFIPVLGNFVMRLARFSIVTKIQITSGKVLSFYFTLYPLFHKKDKMQFLKNIYMGSLFLNPRAREEHYCSWTFNDLNVITIQWYLRFLQRK